MLVNPHTTQDLFLGPGNSKKEKETCLNLSLEYSGTGSLFCFICLFVVHCVAAERDLE